MGLLTILKKIKLKEREVRILVLGLDNAGKTTLVQRLLLLQQKERQQKRDERDQRKEEGEGTAAEAPDADADDDLLLSSIEPTLGFRIRTLHHASTGLSLHVWDVGGQSSLRAYWRNYFEQTDGLVFAVDASEPGDERLLLARSELERLLREERLAGAPLLVWANKQDVAGARSASEIASILGLGVADGDGNEHDDAGDGGGLLRNRHWTIQACSAATGEGVQEGLDWIVQDIASRIFVLK